MSFLAEKCEIVSASRRRSARDCSGAIVERVLWAVLVRGLAVGAEAVVGLAAAIVVRTGRAGVGIATGMAGAAGIIGAAKFSGADFGSGVLKIRGVETGVEVATGAGAEKSSGAETGAGAEKSSGAEIWMREVVGRVFGAEEACILEAERIVLLFSSDSRSESKEIVTFFGVEAGAGAAYEVMVGAD